jgi:hypothetical protein
VSQQEIDEWLDQIPHELEPDFASAEWIRVLVEHGFGGPKGALPSSCAVVFSEHEAAVAYFGDGAEFPSQIWPAAANDGREPLLMGGASAKPLRRFSRWLDKLREQWKQDFVMAPELIGDVLKVDGNLHSPAWLAAMDVNRRGEIFQWFGENRILVARLTFNAWLPKLRTNSAYYTETVLLEVAVRMFGLAFWYSIAKTEPHWVGEVVCQCIRAGALPCGWAGTRKKGNIIVHWPHESEPEFDDA